MRIPSLCLLIAACSSGGSASDHTKSCNDLATARCTRLMGCSASDFSRRYASTADCVTRIGQVCLNSFAAPQNAITDDHTESCATFLGTQDCDSFLADVTAGPCVPSPGPRAAGAGCAFSGQCLSGYCSVPTGSSCGSCAAQPQVGDACGDCGVQGLVCSNGTCVQPLAANAACSNRMGAPCVSGTVCVGGAGGMMMMGTCQPELTTAGATCDERRRTAADCSRDASLYCTAAGMCMAAASATGGMMCGQINGVLTICATGGCFGATALMPGTCASPAPDGMPCDTTNGPPCNPPARCVGSSSDAGTSGTCQLQGSTSC